MCVVFGFETGILKSVKHGANRLNGFTHWTPVSHDMGR